MTDSSGWLAFLDESMPHPRPGVEPCYIIAAALLDAADCDDARWEIGKLAGKHSRFHWRAAKPPERHRTVGTVAVLPTLHIVVVAAPLDKQKQERSRSKALQRILHELDQHGVSRVCMDARTPRLNRRDDQTVNLVKVRGEIPLTMHVTHEDADDEPLLWVPDAVAGAVGSANEAYTNPIRPLINLIQIRSN